jgi:hypothetical protein
MKQIVLLCASLLLPELAFADTIVSFAGGPVTWVATGETNRGFTTRPDQPFPPIGTPFTLTLTFDPGAAFPTATRPASATNCLAVNVSGSLDLGGVTFQAGSSSLGFTNSQLPGTNCNNSGETQFGLSLVPVADSPWDVRGALLIASYRDLIMRDAFPEVPSGSGSWWLQSPLFPPVTWEVGGRFAPSAVAVEQPLPVPEPGTLTLFGLGLAAVVRKVRRRNR